MMSRTTSNCGWTTTCTVRCCRAERHRHRVDEERHVVGDDLDHRVPARGPAVLGDRGGEHPHLGGALRARRRELAGARRARRTGRPRPRSTDVLGRDVAVVGAQQVGRDPGRRAAGAPSAAPRCRRPVSSRSALVSSGGGWHPPTLGLRAASGDRRHRVAPSRSPMGHRWVHEVRPRDDVRRHPGGRGRDAGRPGLPRGGLRTPAGARVRRLRRRRRRDAHRVGRSGAAQARGMPSFAQTFVGDEIEHRAARDAGAPPTTADVGGHGARQAGRG